MDPLVYDAGSPRSHQILIIDMLIDDILKPHSLIAWFGLKEKVVRLFFSNTLMITICFK